MNRLSSWIIVPASSIPLFAFFYFLRSRALVYGDGYTILAFVSSPEIFFGRLEILQISTILLQRWAYLNLTGISGLTAEQVFALVNCLGGVIGFWAVVRIIIMLESEGVSRWFLALATFTGGTVILFFGYIENYTWAWAAGLWSLAFTIGRIKGKNPWWAAFVTGLIAISFHIIMLPFFLTALISLIWKKGGEIRSSRIFELRFIAAAVIVIAPIFVFLVENYGPDFVFVSLWPQGENDYWFLSVRHILDLINHIILVAPVGMVLLIVTLRKWQFDSMAKLLGLAALFNFLVAFWFDPLVGMPRDWDLLSAYGIPLSLLGCYLFISTFPNRKLSATFIVPAVVIFLAAIGPNIIEKNSPAVALERIDRLSYSDPHYAARQSKRIMAWTDILRHETGREDLAEKYYRRQVSGDLASYKSWYNMGEIYLNKEKYDSAAACYEMAIKINPGHAMSWCQLARAEEIRANLKPALFCIKQAAELEPSSDLIETTYGVILMRAGEFREAISHLTRSVNLNPNSAASNRYAGVGYYSVKQYDSACFYLKAAYRLEPGRPKILELLIQALLETGDFDSAGKYIEEYALIYPESPRIEEYRKRLLR